MKKTVGKYILSILFNGIYFMLTLNMYIQLDGMKCQNMFCLDTLCSMKYTKYTNIHLMSSKNGPKSKMNKLSRSKWK